MELLKNRILKDGKVIGDSIIKVDSFLNHQLDIDLFNEIGREFKKRFSDEKISRILTVEASG
ncbi:MAG TPA: xanthine phosphoribosyltransferase, partial [Clostridia bacterium]|nr:xanthine phosphoribosyltransferase [Clostridia bacterium]